MSNYLSITCACLLFCLPPINSSADGISIDTLQAKAERGDVEAQKQLGKAYAVGENGLQPDLAKSFEWYLKAARTQDAEAEHKVGWGYINGNGTSTNYAEGVRWFRLAAARQHPAAQRDLGRCYLFGVGVPEDGKEAIKWFRKAADQLEPQAEFLLGACYDDGEGGLEKNHSEALKWYRRASDHGNRRGQCCLGMAYLDGKGVPKDQVQARELIRKAAEQGDAEAQFHLGWFYADDGNATEAFKWFKLSAESGFAPAQNKLGDCYATGTGVAENPDAALKWWRAAAERGSRNALEKVGRIYSDRRDYGEAIKWLLKGAGLYRDNQTFTFWLAFDYAQTGNMMEALKWSRKVEEVGGPGKPWAEGYIALCYMKGQGGVSKDLKEGFKWAMRAAKRGYAPAQIEVAVYYREGYAGVPVDFAECLKWLIIAAENKTADPDTHANAITKQRVIEPALYLDAELLAEVKRLARQFKPISD